MACDELCSGEARVDLILMCKVIQVFHISVSPFPSAEIEDIKLLATVLSLKLEVKEAQPTKVLGYFSPFLRRLSCHNFGGFSTFHVSVATHLQDHMQFFAHGSL